MTRSFLQRGALLLGAVCGLIGTRPATANAQKALVYCPVNVDATGCNAIVAALTGPAFPLGVHRGYDGTGGTVDLKAVDLFSYSAFIVPSLADGGAAQPYAKLRDPEVAEHLKAALIGRIAMWSGTPDQGATNRAMKDALIQNLAGWAAGAYASARGPGLVALLDASSSAVTRYDWVRAITPVPVTSDPNLLIYSDVRALNPRATAMLTSGAGPIAYANMATFGFQVPNGAAGVSLDAVGQTGTSQGGQVVLLTMEAGNASGATVKTDKDDYAPFTTVVITGAGWQPGETVRLSLHHDPIRDNDTELTAVADGSGNISNTDFAPAQYDIDVRFVLTAIGASSGRRAQTTFTDGNPQQFDLTTGQSPIPVVAGNTATYVFTVVIGGNNNACLVSFSAAPTGPAWPPAPPGGYFAFSPPSATSVNADDVVTTLTVTTSAAMTPGATYQFNATMIRGANCQGTGNIVTGPIDLVIAGVAPPTAVNDSYSTNEDQPLTVTAPGVLGNDAGAGPLSASLVSNTPAADGSVTLNSNGGFTFTPALNFNGSTSFTYRAQNAGGFSAPATVTITVNAVNDAPSFTKGADQTVDEDAAAQTVLNWATAISAGPADESGQAVSFNTLNTNNPLFSVQPSVASNGTLTYTPAPNAFGTAIVTVSAQDNGGTANGGDDTSDGQTFTITINAVNDAPSFTNGADQSVAEDAGAQTVPTWATAIIAGPANESAQVLTFVITDNSNPSLFSAGPAVAANGTLTYTPAANANGSATIKLKLTDDGGVANGGVNESAEQTFVITVNAVNDAPTFVKGADQTVLEDAGAQSVANWATAMSAGPADEAGQTLTFQTSNDNNALFSAQPTIASDGTLTYTAAPNAYGSATVTVTLKDNGGTANGGIDTSAPQTFTITVTPVNDEPSFVKGANQTVNEDAGPQTVAGWATAISAGPNEASQLVDFQVTNDNNTLFSTQPAVAPNGTLTYTTAANAHGSATVTVRIHDDGGVANGGDDLSDAQTFTITVNSVNDAPSFVKGADQTVLEDAGAQTVGGWATAISAGPADEETQVLTFNVTNTNNALFSAQPTIAPDGTLSYTPAPNQYGSATVTVTLSDDGGTANGGIDTSAPQMFTITVTPVNDAPSFTKGADQTVNEDAAPASVTGWATSISAGPNEASQAVDFIVTNDNNALFAVQPAVSPTGSLSYTLAPNANGAATVTVQIHDNGGTANGGVDTSAPQTFTITVNPVNDAPSFVKGADQTVLEDAGAQSVLAWATSISAGPADEAGQTVSFGVTNDNNALFSVQPTIAPNGDLTYTPAPNAYGMATVTVTLSDNGGTANGGDDTSDAQTFTINVTPVNDAPSFTKGLDQTVNEDAGLQTVSGWATAISAGPNEASQTVSFTVTNDNNSLFAVQPAVSPIGTLTYTPAANEFGSATVTLFISDNGGTANGGVDQSTAQTFTITVNSVNDAPSFVKGADQTVLEDSGPHSVASWATSISAGPTNESGQTVAFSALNDNSALFSVQPAISPTGTLSYTLAPNAYGSATVTVTLSDDGGTANGGIDTSAPQTFTITVTPVNDAPSFTKGADQTVNEDAGSQMVAGWATAISAGPNEASQAVDFVVTNNNNSLFSVQPAIAPNGTLTYTPAANEHGSATVTVVIHDDGGTADGGDDTSDAQTFVITVNSVNDVPSFLKGADQTVLEDAAAQTVAGWATSISAGPANESGQTLTFNVTNDNNSLFTAGGQPAIAANGTLTFTPAPNQYGSATVTVTLSDNGGTANGGIDTSAPQAFTITVKPVNDEPSFTKGANQTVLEDTGAQTVAGWATAISAGPNEPLQTVQFVVTNDNNALFSTQPAVAPNGTLTYTPAADAFGSATVTVIITDDGGTADGGDDTSNPQTFTIDVTPVNDAPTYTLIPSETSAEDAGPQTVLNAVTAKSVGPANEVPLQTFLSLTTTNNNTALFTAGGQPTIDLTTGTLTYTAATNANGTATVTVVLKDDGGTLNGGVDQTTKTFVLTITKENDAPVINSFTGPIAPNAVNTSITVNGYFTDIDLGDATLPAESHTVTIEWGDATSSTPSPSGSGTTRSITANHTYTSPGVYTVKLTVTDLGNLTDTEIYQYVVVYDPNAGFVTGGGWITSPAGAYVANPILSGKATFGFVSKYKKGQTTPDGNTEFQFHAAGMNFKSSVYEWLVIAGAKAQFKGSGTIDGAGNYGFLLMAIDGQLPGGGGADKFRIKIWDKDNGDAVVYDNQILAAETADPTTSLGGGSINIQAK